MRRAARVAPGGIGGASVVRRGSRARWAGGIVRILVARVSRVRSAPVKTGAVRAARVSAARVAATVVREPERVPAWVRASVSVAQVGRVLAARGKTLCAPRIVGPTLARTLR